MGVSKHLGRFNTPSRIFVARVARRKSDLPARGRWASMPRPEAAKEKRQPACKPGSVRPRAEARDATAIHLGRRLPGASRDRPGRLAWIKPGPPEGEAHAVPSWSCSRWGLPCRPRCRVRGGPLPHPFTLTRLHRPVLHLRRSARSGPLGTAPPQEGGRFAFCGTFPGVTPAGCYPAPFIHGARTFLPAALSGLGEAAVRPAGRGNVAKRPGSVKRAQRNGLSVSTPKGLKSRTLRVTTMS